MIIPTDQAEQSRNIRWTVLHRACKLASMMSSVRGMSHILDPDIEEKLRHQIRLYMGRWSHEYVYAALHGFLSGQKRRDVSHVK